MTLIWVNPDTNCNAEAARMTVVRNRLPTPLSGRALVQAASGRPVPYFDACTGPAGPGAQLTIAQLVVTKEIIPLTPWP